MVVSKINRNLDDLHPDDRLNRLRLRDWMQEEMRVQGVGNRELAARVRKAAGWSYGITTGLNWRAASLQELVRALGYTLHLEPRVAHVIVPPRTSVALSEVYAGHRDPSQRDEAARRDLGDYARRLREVQNLTSAMLAKRLNSGGDVVRIFEEGDRPYFLLVTAQRHFRALGAELSLVLEGEDGVRFEPPVGRWDGAGVCEVNIIELEDRTLVWNSRQPETVVSFPADVWKLWLEAVR